MPPTRHCPPNPKSPIPRWSLVERACQPDTPEDELAALQKVCLSYWYPLYAWARQSTGNPEDAADLVRGLFERMLEKRFFVAVDRENGRLRTFLLTCLKRHANDVRDQNPAARREARNSVSLDFAWAERRFHGHAAPGDSPDAVYDRRWAHTLLHYTLGALEIEMVEEGKGDGFAVLKGFLEFRPDLESSREEIAAKLGITEADLRSQVFRLRKRFHELLMAQVAMTIGEGENPKDELMALMASV
jgi:RNA polymerase sigma-70 factor (ECF subfamily)